jgi:hypothetical protein
MMSGLTTKEKQELGKVYYINMGLSAKETSTKIKVTEQTLGKWIEKFGWKSLKAAENAKPDKIISNIYDNILAIQEDAKKEKRSLTAVETDSIIKLTGSIRNIKKESNLETYGAILMEFNNFIKEVDLLLSQKNVDYMHEFLQAKAKQFA